MSGILNNAEPNIVQISAAIGEAARASMLTALMGGQALTATELADAAGVTRQTASVHLGKLMEAGLLTQVAQGRHRYFRLAGANIAALIETLMGVARQMPSQTLGTQQPELRKARVCYDHLAGDLGVEFFDGLVRHGLLVPHPSGLSLSHEASVFFAPLKIDVHVLTQAKRPLCLACLDWSVRRPHLAGALGAAFLTRCFELNWCRQDADSRVLHFSKSGERALRGLFDSIK